MGLGFGLSLAGVVVAGYAAAVGLKVFLSPKDDLDAKFPYSVTVIGHRGGSIIGPENTIYTFRKAVENHTNMLELDVRKSKDGHIIVCHDSSLARTCGPSFENVSIGDIAVADGPLPQSARTIKLEFRSATQTHYEADDSIPADDSTRICLLEQVFQDFPSTPLHIDIKESDAELVAQVLEMIDRYGRATITFVGSSNNENVDRIHQYLERAGKEVRSRFRLFAGEPEVIRTYLLFYSGLLPFFNIEYDVLSIPIVTKSMSSAIEKEFGKPLALAASFLLNSPFMWRYLQRRGVAVLGWVVNDEADFAQAAQWPLNGVMSDNPIALYKFLTEHRSNERLRRLGE